jgi:hypothetical protein
MSDRRIEDFATLAEAKDNDLILVSSESETYNMKVKTLKDAVQGSAEAAAASAAKAEKAAEKAEALADTANTNANNALTRAADAELAAQTARGEAKRSENSAASAQSSATAAQNSATEAQTSAATAEQNATEAIEVVNDLSENVTDMQAQIASKVDDAYVTDGYLYLTSNDEVVAGPLGPFSGTGGGGGGGSAGGSTIRITNRMPSRSFSVMDGTAVNMLYGWTATDSDDNEPIGDGSALWYVNGTKVATQIVQQGDNSFNVTNYLVAASTNTVKLTIEDAYGNSKSFTWTIAVTTFNLSWNLDELEAHGSAAVTVRLIPTGDGTKIIHLAVDGEEIYNTSVSTTGRTVTTTIPAQAHGSHTVTAWLETTANGEVITTPALKHVGIWTVAGNTQKVVAVYDSTPTVAQFATASIRYMAYDPSSLTTEVTLKKGDTVINTLTVDKGVQTWAYRATVTGTNTLSIEVGTAIAPIEMTVTSLGYDINAVTNGLVLDIDPTGHSNSENDRNTFGYKDGEGVNHPFTYSPNFDWINGGFQLDSDGVTAFVVKRGTYITADCSLFNDNATQDGKEIKAVFKAVNVRDYDAEILNCVSDDGIGLKLQAQQAVLSSELKSVTIPYCENTQIEMDINIEASNENRLAVVWLRGTPARAFTYTANDNWTQASTKLLTIGSADCDVWIYRLKMYNNSLTRYEVLDNYVADCGNVEEMVARYERNDIFNDNGTINIPALAAANPKLRILRIAADRMTTGKSDSVTCSVELIYTFGGAEYNFTATNVIMKAQGTSSAAYGEAAFNLDLDFSNAVWTNGNGETITEYAMTENSIPVNYFNIKLNVASSENANNVCLADDYNTYNPFKTAARQADGRVRDTVEGHPCTVFFTNTSSSVITVGAISLAPNETMLYGNGDMNNSKKNFAVFGQDNSVYSEQCCVEFLNNTSEQCRFKSDDLTNEKFDGDGNFEFRYPKKPTDSNKAAFQAMLSWVVSTDTTAATNAPLGQSVTLGGTTYTNDTALYRGAKFKAEFGDYFSKDSMTFHYVFTERHCMIDNRAKNVFFSCEYDNSVKGYRWNVTKDYDNDTGEGNDNEGGLTFTYGLEDTDTIGTKMVFNAADSVLWCNMREYMADDLEAMFKTCEAAGAWNAQRILAKFKAHQETRPEALVVEDMWKKYFNPYINNGNTAYIDMMQGNKEDQRTQFETYQEVYCSTKYYGSVATSDAITFRGNTPLNYTGVVPTGDMAITPYADMYIIVKYGSLSVKVRAKRGGTYPIVCPVSALNDTEIYLYASSNIVEISSIAGLYCQYIDLGNAYRLRKFVAGSDANGYSNLNLTAIGLGNNTMLEHLDLRGTPALTQALDLTHLTSLTELYLTSSGVTGVTFAVGAPIETAALSAVNSLIARGLTSVKSFSMDGSKLRTLWVENCAGINTLNVVNAATGLTRGRLPDIAWSVNTADILMRLSALAGLDEAGNNISSFVLGGSCYIDSVSQEEITEIIAKFPDLNVTYGTMVDSYTVTFKDTDGKVLNEQTVRQYGSAVNPVTAGLISAPTKEPTVDNVYTFIGWDKAFNYILADTEVTAVYSETTRQYTVRWWNGTALLQTDIVDARGEIAYRGDDLVSETGAIWVGWDALTNEIVSDMDVHASFISPKLPDAVATNYDYLYSDDPNDNSGYSLAEFYGIMTSGLAKNYFNVGDEVKIVPNTTAFVDSEIVVQVYGFKHYKLADDSGDFAEIVFGMKGIMNAVYQMNGDNTNVGGWPVSKMRTYLNDTVFKNLPQQWKTMIKTVKVLSSEGNTSANIVTSEDKLFLFSQAEVGFNTTDVPYKNEVDVDAETKTFAIFTDYNSRIKKYYNGEGTANYWWLRSPSASHTTTFCFVSTNGSSTNGNAGNSHGVAFGFCI